MTGYEELRTSAAWIDLSARGTIIATGEDRARFLHAMTTNHVQQLAPGGGCYAFFLNAQGRIQADVELLCRTDDFLLDIEPEVRESLYQHLDHYIIADDVMLDDATARLAKIGLEGPEAEAALRQMGAPVLETGYAHVMWGDVLVARLTFTGAPGFRLFLPAEAKSTVTQDLPEADAEAARVVRLEHGKPRYGEDIFSTTLAQETQQMHAVSFSKGCYIGQEIVERVRSRGLVHRVLVGIETDSTVPPEPGTRVHSGEENVGKTASAAFSPFLGKVVAMAYVRRDLAVRGTRLSVDGHPALVR